MKIKHKDALINFEIDGGPDSPAVLLWNGARCSLRMWDFVVEKIKDRYRLIRFDVRGTGHSEYESDENSNFSLEQYAEDANEILDYLQIDQVLVWSMAWGSRAAIAYCALHPERVVNATFNDASVVAPDVVAQMEGAKQSIEKQVAEGIDKFKKPEGYNTNVSLNSVTQALAAASRFDLQTQVNLLRMPILLVAGDHDPNLESSKKISDKLQNASLKILKNVGHGSVLQRPDLCINAFLEFQNDQK